MVETRTKLLTALALVLFLAILLVPANAQDRVWRIDREYTKIWINQDGTIDLFYNITLNLLSGANINWITVGQPNGDFTLGEALDQHGNNLTITDTNQGTQYEVKVNLHQPLTAGNTIWFTLLTNVGHMVYNDSEMNPGNLGMEFIPSWFQVTTQELRISIVLPEGVNKTMVKTERDYSNTFIEDGRLVVYWEASNLAPDTRYTVGVSFPQEHMPSYTPPDDGKSRPSGFSIPNPWPYALLLLVLGIAAFSIFAGIRMSKAQYFAPSMSMETLGHRTGLTAVEASYLLEMKPPRLVTEILYSTLQKRAVWVEATKPSLKLQIMPKYQNPRERKEALRYYETQFLNAIKPDGTLDEEKLAQTIITVRDTVEDKMRGYCRKDTVEYYRSIVKKAWRQVEKAGTPELASNAYDEQLLWLLLDPSIQTRTQTIFRDQPFTPNPMWFWYWYGYRHYHPHPTYEPNIQNPAQSAKPPNIPGSDFANNIANSVTQTSNNIVANLEKFANSIVPAPPSAKASHQPAHHGATCVCACHACACACACVSCACACAGGGVG